MELQASGWRSAGELSEKQRHWLPTGAKPPSVSLSVKAPAIPRDYVPADLPGFAEYRFTSVLAQLRGLNISTLDDAKAIYSDGTNTWNRLALGFWYESEGDWENAVRSYRHVWELELRLRRHVNWPSA